MAIKTLRVFQEFTSAGYVPMPVAGNIDYGVTIAGTFPGTTPTTFQTDDPDIDVTLTATTDYYVWIRSHGTDWNPMYTRNVRVYPDSPLVNNVVMGIIIANLDNTVPYTGATENVDLGTYGLKADYLQLNTSPTSIPTTEGTIAWNSSDGTANLRLKGGTINLQVGEDSVARVVNGTTSNLLRADYKVVKIIGAQGQRLQVGLALANNDANSKDTIGLVAENINNNQEGFIMTSGVLDEINTTGSLQGETWLDGDTLYLSGTTAGKITNIKPQAPTHTIILGFVAYAHQNHGKIYVKVDNGYEIDELHNVKITTVANKNILVYETATSLWKNRNIFGTQGYVPYYDDTLLMKNSVIYTDGTQVIIGDDEEFSVGNKLSVVGNIAVHKDYGYHSGLYQILFRQDATGEFRIGTNAANDYTTFYANGTERVRISPSGFLGVGLTNPTSILHVKGTTAYTNAIIDNNSASGGGYYSAYQNGAEKAIFGVSGAWLLNNTSDAALIAKGVGQGIQFYTNGSTSEKMGINSDGNVFVGQTPTYVAGATQLVVRGKTGAGFVGVNHYDMSIKGFMNTFNSVFQVGTSTFHSLAFLVENIERGRVNSSGRLLWGTTTDNTTDLVQINGSLIASSLKKSGGLSTQFLKADGSVDSTTYGLGTVTSVALSAPTGFSVSGSPITTSGTLALGFASGYSLPSDATQATWTAKQNALNGTGFVKIVGTTISYDNSTYYLASNPSAYISGITSLMVTNALGYTPYNATNPSGYISGNQTITLSGDVSGSGATAITTTLATITQGATGSFVKITLDTKGRVTGNVAVGSSDITSALGYTPYNSTNPSGYISGITSLMVTNALGYTPYNSTNPAGYTTNVGTVTSVAMSVPTGLSISGSPITTSGTLALSLSAGYSIPTTSSQGTWDTAYNRSLTSIGVSGTTTKTLTLTKQDGTTLTASWSDINTDAVTSVFGRTGAIVATSGDYTTAQVTESGNLYYLDSRARASISGGTGISYNSTTGVITNTITQYTDALARASISGGTGISYNSTSGVITNTITQYTDALARASLSFVAGSGAYNSTTGVITIPTNNNQIANGAGYITGITSLMVTNALGYTPVTNARQLTINGTTYDLSADRSWTISGTIGGLTSGYIPKATSASTLGNSLIYDNGTQAGFLNGGQFAFYAGGSYSFAVNGVNVPYFGLASGVEPGGSGNATVFISGYDSLKFYTNNSEKMRLTSAGNLGIGTTSINVPLEVNGAIRTTRVGAASQYLQIEGGDAVGAFITATGVGKILTIRNNSTSSSNIVFEQTVASSYFFRQAGTDNLILNQFGNLGLGVTPSDWNTAYKAFQLGNGSIMSRATASDIYVLGNAYFDAGGFKYYNTGYAATMYNLDNGSHVWRNAPSGTAGNAITFTQAMTLNANGKLSIGNTNNTYNLDVTGSGNTARLQGGTSTFPNLRIQSAIYPTIEFISDDTNSANRNWKIASVYNQYGMFEITSSTTAGATDYTPRLAIANSGNVLINTTTDLGYKLDVNGTGRFSGAITINQTASTFGSGLNLLNWQLVSGGDFGLYIGYSGTTRLSIASTGAATFSSSVTAGGSVTIGTGGNYATGSIYSDASWGMIFRAKQASPSNAEFRWANSADSELMRISPSGGLQIGTTTDSGYKLDVNGTGIFRSSGTSTLRLKGNSTTGIDFQNDSGGGYIWNRDNTPIYFATNNTQRLVISETGAATFSSSVTATSFIKTGGTSSQYLMADGSVTTSSGGVGGSGTTNYISKWNGTTSLANSQIFDNGTQVTVGSNVAMYKFAVNPVSNSYFGIGFTGTNQIFVNAVDSGFTAVPIVNNALSHTWLIGFGDAMLLNNSGNLLIGTTSGVSGGGKLQVNGDVNINGNFKINGTVIGGGGGSGITGSGTTNMIAKWTGGTSLGDSALYDNGAYSIGIGTTSVSFPTDRKGLVIRPNGANSGEILLQNSGNTNGSTDGFAIANINGDGVALYNRINAHIRFGTNNTERLRITEDGNLGFGTTSQFGGGVKVIGIANSTTIPNTTPSGGGILFVQNGALKYMGSNGTYTTIANA